MNSAPLAYACSVWQFLCPHAFAVYTMWVLNVEFYLDENLPNLETFVFRAKESGMREITN